jgi:hypothetical protein
MVDKQKQFELITNSNPYNLELGNHTWIKNVSDIKTYEEVWQEEGEIYGITPDFSKKDAINALNSGKIVVYSSYPIKNGTFVTPSKMEAINYSGNHKIYTITTNLNDIAWIDPVQGQYANTNVTENKKYMKKIIRLTESDLHKIIMGSVKRIIKEDFDQFSDGDFASEGNPYEMDTYNPISEVEHITPQDLRNVYVWETGDSYYEFEADYGEGMSEAVSIRGSFDGDFTIDDVVLGHSGFGRQMNRSDVQSSQFDEWFNTTLGDHLARVIYNKIDNGDFANDAESGY